MEEIGIVKEIKGAIALVIVQKQSVCEKCAAGSVCKSTSGEMEVEVLNNANAGIGDKVRIVFRPCTYLKGSLLIYGIPAVSLVIGAVIGKEYMRRVLPNTDPTFYLRSAGSVF